MNKTQLKIQEEHVGLRLDNYLAQTHFIDTSRNHIQLEIKAGHIRVNDVQVKTGYALKLNDIITIMEVEPKKLDLEAVDLKLDIVYEDEDLLVINKPQGMVVHPASSYHEPTLVHGLLHEVDALSSINGIIRPGIVHRIDKDTSGLLVVAKNDRVHQLLSEDLSNHQIQRKYMALAYGVIAENEGTIDAPINRHPKNRLKMAVLAGGKRAVTHFKVLERFEKFTLVSCQLETGRTHQIRVHLAFINHPIVGDVIYGPKAVIGTTGQFLHATELAFMHPTKKEHMTFTADMPQNFKDVIDALRQGSAL